MGMPTPVVSAILLRLVSTWMSDNALVSIILYLVRSRRFPARPTGRTPSVPSRSEAGFESLETARR